MRARSLIASSSALIVASIFTVASPAAASVRENATASSSAVNAGVFVSGPRSVASGPISAGRIGDGPAWASTPKNGLCDGTWGDSVANVPFQRAKSGALNWGFLLTKAARQRLGRVVRVTMPYATVNNRQINSPYSPHTASSGSNFHSSLHYYQFIGSRTRHVIETGNKIFLYWVIFDSSGGGAYRYIRCTVPRPGS